MNVLKKSRGILKDERAQSLTEFAVVIPIILLLFFAMLQYLAVVQAHQLGNYAVYAAARSYAVHAALSIHETGNDERAKDFALSAAAMVLAPIATLMPGETEALGYDPTEFQLTGTHLEKLATGYFVAKNLRLSSSILGGSLSISTGGDPKQVNVTMNYPQPIYVPGLVELWNYVAGEKIFTAMESLRAGLEGVPKSYGTYQMAKEQGADVSGMEISDALAEYLILCPHINVRSKCSMGYEEWGAEEKFRPRLPNTVDAEEVTDPGLEEQAREMDQLRQDLEDAQNRRNTECDAYNNAHNARLAAEAKVAATAPGSQERAEAEQELEDAQEYEAEKQASCQAAKADVDRITEQLEDLMD